MSTEIAMRSIDRETALRTGKPLLPKGSEAAAYLDGSKTEFRMPVRYRYDNTEMRMRTDKYGTCLVEIEKDIEGVTHGTYPSGQTWRRLRAYIVPQPKYHRGDILYVRESFCPDHFELETATNGNRNAYKADYNGDRYGCSIPEPKWTPASRMPKGAARLFLLVTEVTAERLQAIDGAGCEREGVIRVNDPLIRQDKEAFDRLGREAYAGAWDAGIRREDRALYSWAANPWVWVYRVERIAAV